MPKNVADIAEIALQAGLVSKSDAARAVRLAEQRGVPLVSALVRDVGVDELALVSALRRFLRVSLVDPAAVQPDVDALREVPRDVCRRLKVLPVAFTVDASGVRVMRLAMADPTDDTAIAEIEQLTSCELDIWALPLSAIEELTEDGYRGFTTQIVQRRPFGDGIMVTGTATPARPAVEDVPATVPHHTVTDEADIALRVRALVQLLVAKNVIREDEYDEAVRELLKRRTDET